MAKKRVPLHQNPRGFVDVDPDATNGAQVGVNLRGPDGQILTAAQVINPTASDSGGPSSIASTIWKLIREIPLNIQKLAVLAGAGFATRQSNGDWALRTLQEGPGIDITNPAGDAGNPMIGLEDVPDSGSGTLLATTFDAKGRKTGSRPATITGTAQQINVANGNAAAGVPTLSLASEVLTSLSKADSSLQPGAAHNTALSGLQGGAVGEYYHVTAAQNAALAALATSGFIDGLRLVRNSGTSITFTTGIVAIQSTGTLLAFPLNVTKSGLSLSASTLYYAYAYSNAGTPDVEISTTVPAAPYSGLARSKTGDTSRRYIGAFLTKADGTLYNFEHSAGYITYKESTDTAPFRVLANGTAIAQTVVPVGSAGVPISTTTVKLNVTNLSTNSALLLSNPSASTVNMQGIRPGNGFAVFFPVDSSLQMTYFFSVAPAGGGGYIDVIGYALER